MWVHGRKVNNPLSELFPGDEFPSIMMQPIMATVIHSVALLLKSFLAYPPDFLYHSYIYYKRVNLV